MSTYPINNLLKEDGDTAKVEIAVVLRLVDQVLQLGLPNFLCAVAKDEQHSVNHVGLAAAVGSNDRGEALSGGDERRGSALE